MNETHKEGNESEKIATADTFPISLNLLLLKTFNLSHNTY